MSSSRDRRASHSRPRGAHAREVAAQADVGGTIARLGQRLVEGVARTTMDRFYACLAKRLT